MAQSRLYLEALSALSGCNVESTSASSHLTPQDFVNVVALREFYKQKGFQQLEYPSLGSMSLVDDADLYGAPPAVTQGPVTDAGPPPSSRPTVKINPNDFFHHEYDYNFTNIQDGDRTFLRGNERYIRPCGWKRVALRVVQRYDDGDTWLGTDKDAWPVSYHGHKMDGSLGIIMAHSGSPRDNPQFLDEAASSLMTNETRGRGVYSTPDIKYAEGLCKTFKSKVDDKMYKVVLQNRINPKKRVKCQRENVWLVYVPEGSTDVQTRVIVEESIRPYGLLLKQA
ncbi:uncharacterized protein LOC117502118 [Thalassophryne amazonica]|uniref:uncharacterized protein LOC117502118 n=1 Tax=Thalassophryne amazonica TaxID=390379 RepID=UPI0014718FCF|nr:uncharacterized protein LOC117502118 [Thalassophryne amazonica]